MGESPATGAAAGNGKAEIAEPDGSSTVGRQSAIAPKAGGSAFESL